MKSAAFVVVASVAVSLSACGGPASSTRSYPSYEPTSFGNAESPPADTGSREARLTAPTAKPTLDTLPGMSGNALTALLGAPQFRRRDGQAEIWQYRGSACTLDVFLYADGGDLRVRYVEARNHGSSADTLRDPAKARACATGLIDARAGTAGPG